NPAQIGGISVHNDATKSTTAFQPNGASHWAPPRARQVPEQLVRKLDRFASVRSPELPWLERTLRCVDAHDRALPEREHRQGLAWCPSTASISGIPAEVQ